MSIVCAVGPLAAGAVQKPRLDLEAERKAMREADSAMSRATIARDMERFSSFLADDVAFLAGGRPSMASGKQAVRELWAGLFETSGPTLSWQPTRAEVASSADLGYTLGTYELTARDPEGKPAVQKGEYVTVWKKQPDGVWRVLFDASNTPAPPAGPGLTTRPLREETSRAGDIAVTVGTFELEAGGAGGAPPARSGRFLTIRRRGGADGTWAVVVDVANPGPPLER